MSSDKIDNLAGKFAASAEVKKNQLAKNLKRKFNDGSEVTEVGVVLSVIVIVGVIAMTPLGQAAADTFEKVTEILTNNGVTG